MPRYETVDALLNAYPERFNPEKAEGVDGSIPLATKFQGLFE